MTVPMMDIRIMRVAVYQGLVPMEVRVGLGDIPGKIVCVPMMLVMRVSMCVRERLVRMRVRVSFAQMQPYAEGHQSGGGPEEDVERLANQHQRKRRTDERSRREICAGTSRTEMAQRHDEER